MTVRETMGNWIHTFSRWSPEVAPLLWYRVNVMVTSYSLFMLWVLAWLKHAYHVEVNVMEQEIIKTDYRYRFAHHTYVYYNLLTSVLQVIQMVLLGTTVTRVAKIDTSQVAPHHRRHLWVYGLECLFVIYSLVDSPMTVVAVWIWGRQAIGTRTMALNVWVNLGTYLLEIYELLPDLFAKRSLQRFSSLQNRKRGAASLSSPTVVVVSSACRDGGYGIPHDSWSWQSSFEDHVRVMMHLIDLCWWKAISAVFGGDDGSILKDNDNHRKVQAAVKASLCQVYRVRGTSSNGTRTSLNHGHRRKRRFLRRDNNNENGDGLPNPQKLHKKRRWLSNNDDGDDGPSRRKVRRMKQWLSNRFIDKSYSDDRSSAGGEDIGKDSRCVNVPRARPSLLAMIQNSIGKVNSSESTAPTEASSLLEEGRQKYESDSDQAPNSLRKSILLANSYRLVRTNSWQSTANTASKHYRHSPQEEDGWNIDSPTSRSEEELCAYTRSNRQRGSQSRDFNKSWRNLFGKTLFDDKDMSDLPSSMRETSDFTSNFTDEEEPLQVVQAKKVRASTSSTSIISSYGRAFGLFDGWNHPVVNRAYQVIETKHSKQVARYARAVAYITMWECRTINTIERSFFYKKRIKNPFQLFEVLFSLYYFAPYTLLLSTRLSSSSSSSLQTRLVRIVNILFMIPYFAFSLLIFPFAISSDATPRDQVDEHDDSKDDSQNPLKKQSKLSMQPGHIYTVCFLANDHALGLQFQRKKRTSPLNVIAVGSFLRQHTPLQHGDVLRGIEVNGVLYDRLSSPKRCAEILSEASDAVAVVTLIMQRPSAPSA